MPFSLHEEAIYQEKTSRFPRKIILAENDIDAPTATALRTTVTPAHPKPAYRSANSASESRKNFPLSI